jgi:hypothetical protein
MLDLIPAISWPGGSPENTGIIAGVIVGAYLGAVWLAALIWTIRDIRDRSEDPITQVVAFLIVLIFNLPGWVLYQVLRPPLTLADVYERQLEEEALRQELDNRLACPSCEHDVEDDYVACPQCATQLKTPCRECSRAVSFAWMACPWCGTRRHEETARLEPIPMASDAAAESADSGAPAWSAEAAASSSAAASAPASISTRGGSVERPAIRPSAAVDAVTEGGRPSPFRRSQAVDSDLGSEASPTAESSLARPARVVAGDSG